MSIKPVDQFPGKVAPATPDNPFGTARNITIPGDGTGTPWESSILKDEWGFQHAMLINAGMEPNGTPDSAENSQLFKAAKASIGNGANLLSNHNFLTSSPDTTGPGATQPPPSATPTSYPPGFQIFSGVFANETTGITGLTYINGRVSFSGGDFYIPRANSKELGNITEFVASVADFDGKPRTRGVSFALVGDEYRVTVGVDALEDAGAVLTPLGSVKFEQGSVATGHEAQYGVVATGSKTPRTASDRASDSIHILDFESLVDKSNPAEWDWIDALDAILTLKTEGTIDLGGLTLPVSRSFDILGKNTNNSGDLKRLIINANGAVIKPTTGYVGDTVRLGETKRISINDLRVGGNVNIAGLWDSKLSGCWFDSTSFGDESWHAGFMSHYWNNFVETRLGDVTWQTSGTRVPNHEFNSNTLSACIIENPTILGNGSFQGAVMIGGEIRGDFTVESFRYSEVPNSLTLSGGVYFDQSNTNSDLKDFEIYHLGVNPQLNSFTFDGQKAAFGGSSNAVALRGAKSQVRTPTSSENLIINGDLRDTPKGTTSILEPRLFNVTGVVAKNGDERPFLRLNTTGSPLVEFVSVPLPFDGWYSFTVMFRRNGPVNDWQLYFKNETTGDTAFDVMGNNSAVLGQFVVGTYNRRLSAGDVVKVILNSGVSGQSIDVAHVGCTYGIQGQLNAPCAPEARGRYAPSSRTDTGFRNGQEVIMGDKVYFSDPLSRGWIGEVCTVSGIIGTTASVKNFGQLEI